MKAARALLVAVLGALVGFLVGAELMKQPQPVPKLEHNAILAKLSSIGDDLRELVAANPTRESVPPERDVAQGSNENGSEEVALAEIRAKLDELIEKIQAYGIKTGTHGVRSRYDAMKSMAMKRPPPNQYALREFAAFVERDKKAAETSVLFLDSSEIISVFGWPHFISSDNNSYEYDVDGNGGSDVYFKMKNGVCRGLIYAPQ